MAKVFPYAFLHFSVCCWCAPSRPSEGNNFISPPASLSAQTYVIPGLPFCYFGCTSVISSSYDMICPSPLIISVCYSSNCNFRLPKSKTSNSTSSSTVCFYRPGPDKYFCVTLTTTTLTTITATPPPPHSHKQKKGVSPHRLITENNGCYFYMEN